MRVDMFGDRVTFIYAAVLQIPFWPPPNKRQSFAILGIGMSILKFCFLRLFSQL